MNATYLPVLAFKAAGQVQSAPDDDARDRLETDLAAALNGVFEAATGRATARLRSPKERKHTRHYVPEHDVDTRVGIKALDTPRIVDPQRWETDAQDACDPLLTAATERAVRAMAVDLGWQDETKARGVSPRLAAAARVGAFTAGALVGRATAARADGLAALLNARDQAGDTLDDILTAVQDWAQANAATARSIAVQAATAAIEAARDALAEQVTALLTAQGLPDPDVTRQWITRLDEKVRDTHRAVHGASRALGTPFAVGGALVMYPGDPTAPPAVSRNCRCRLIHRATVTGKFVPAPPAGSLT